MSRLQHTVDIRDLQIPNGFYLPKRVVKEDVAPLYVRITKALIGIYETGGGELTVDELRHVFDVKAADINREIKYLITLSVISVSSSKRKLDRRVSIIPEWYEENGERFRE